MWLIWILMTILLSISFGVLLIYQQRARLLSNPRYLPYPPGPKPLPILGNLFYLIHKQEALDYVELAKKYGDLVFLSAFGKKILFVNSFKAAHDLFEKRSSNYSDRNQSIMVHELIGWDWSFGHMRYGKRWKTHRRIFHSQFQQSTSSDYRNIQEHQAYKLVQRLLHSPHMLIDHLRHHAASMIMQVTYGITIAPHDDKYITIAEKALEGMAQAANPSAFIVDLIPILKFIPEWFPGATFKRKAREWRMATLEMRDAPFRDIVMQSAKNHGSSPVCFVSKLLDEMNLSKSQSAEQISVIKNCAGLAYAGMLSCIQDDPFVNYVVAGTGSIVSALSSFILAIVAHPEVLVKAHEELDLVIGHGRLPNLGDREALPYIDAIVKEILRWNPVAPLGLPHMATHNDEYNGYFIPAGTTIVGNTWAILHDSETYPDPHRFDPGRFMDRLMPSSLDPLSSAFGYGRRICPGRFIAESQLWISIVCILSIFDIGPGVDEKGEAMRTESRFSPGMICHPLPFNFSITPRGDYVRALVEHAYTSFK